MDIAEKINKLVSSDNYILIVAVLVLLCLFLLVRVIMLRMKTNSLNSKFTIIDTIDDIIKEDDYQIKLRKTLELVSSYIAGEGYYIYMYEANKNRYRLESVIFNDEHRTKNNERKADVGYGRLIAYEKESYSPQLVFENTQIPDHISVVMHGRFSILILPILMEKGFITISVKRKKNYTRDDDITYLHDKLKGVFQSISVQASPQKNLPRHHVDEDQEDRLSKIMDMIFLIIGCDAGIFLTIYNNYCEMMAIRGFSEEQKQGIENNIELSTDLVTIINREKQARISRDDARIEHLPPYLKEIGFQEYLVLGLDEGIFIACYKHVKEDGYFIECRIRMAKLLLAKLYEPYNTNVQSDEYFNNELDSIVRCLDYIDPYFVGYSDQMLRYATMITRAMQLDEEQANEIKRAAFLSNIGVMGIAESILRKNGLYSKAEYEIVKKHVEYGAFIASMFSSNKNIANIVLHHHERMDGKGYPLGLKGDEISLGSRIIAVLQSFLSKMHGRPYRQPMPFADIISSLQADRALDSNLVKILVDWFNKKLEDDNLIGKPLGKCWEMQCSPKSICQSCPAYFKDDKFCWEHKENNCQAHGNNSCKTCFVYTEYIYRNAAAKERKK